MTKKNRRHSSRKRRRRRALLLRITAVLLLIPVLAAAGIFAYLYTHPIKLKDNIVKHELMEPFDPWENVKDLYFADKTDVDIQSEADVEKLGDYPVTYTCRGHEYKATVKIVDTTPPALKVHPYKTDLSGEVTPEKFEMTAGVVGKTVAVDTVHIVAVNMPAETMLEITGADRALFGLSHTSIPAGSSETDVVVTYSPAAIGKNEARLMIDCPQMPEVYRTIAISAYAIDEQNPPAVTVVPDEVPPFEAE